MMSASMNGNTPESILAKVEVLLKDKKPTPQKKSVILQGFKYLYDIATRNTITAAHNSHHYHTWRKHKNAQETVVAAYLDLNKFKQVNDIHGHEQGDHVLRRAKEIIENCCRKSDLVMHDSGDEFKVILAHAPDNAEEFAERFKSKVKKASESLPHGTSFAVGTAVGKLKNIKTLFNKADVAMYEDKHKNQGQGR